MAVSPATIQTDYPIPVFRYNVDIDGFNDGPVTFSEVSGLEMGVETITYKDGLRKLHMPGQSTDTSLTLKRGIVRAGSEFFDWINSISLNLIDKRDLTISLTDETGDTPIITWTVPNLFPTKLTAPTWDATANEVAVETLELMGDDGITISYG